jgi:NAD(P)-dependent dehydrogenase (short-subunit alcohol dehydrogenase family)
MIELKNSPFRIPDFDLTGKVAIVTGSTKGLGEGMVWALVAYGAKVVVNSRHQADCEAIARQINEAGGEALAVQADVRNKVEVDDMVAKTVAKFGRLDIMVSNAGIGITKRITEMTEEEWDEVVDTDLKGVFLCGAAAARVMIEQKTKGRIINISSAGGLVGTKNIAAYCASKAGVISLSKTMAMEFGRYGITANAVCPGYIPTSINKKPLEIPKVREQILGKTALKRLGEIDEISPIIVFLASDASSIVTGACIAADMGTTCN